MDCGRTETISGPEAPPTLLRATRQGKRQRAAQVSSSSGRRRMLRRKLGRDLAVTRPRKPAQPRSVLPRRGRTKETLGISRLVTSLDGEILSRSVVARSSRL